MNTSAASPSLKTRRGGCHRDTGRFDVDLELRRGTFRCGFSACADGSRDRWRHPPVSCAHP